MTTAASRMEHAEAQTSRHRGDGSPRLSDDANYGRLQAPSVFPHPPASRGGGVSPFPKTMGRKIHSKRRALYSTPYSVPCEPNRQIQYWLPGKKMSIKAISPAHPRD